MSACPHCGSENKPGNEFCTTCGKPIPGGDSFGDLLDAGIVCPACDTYNEASEKKCVRCGQSLSGMTGMLSGVSESSLPKIPEKTVVEPKPEGIPKTPGPGDTIPQVSAVPAPAGAPTGRTGQQRSQPKRPTGQLPAAVASHDESGLCPHCQARLPASAVFCLACGRKLAKTQPGHTQPADVSIRLRLTRGYGREDSTFPVGPSGVSVGRGKALVNVAEDPYLSPLHMTLRLQNGQLVVEDGASMNGTFLRVRGKKELRQGTEFLAGGQRFVLLGLGGPTTDVRMPASADTRPYGGPQPRQLFIALRVLHGTASGKALAGAVILRAGPVVTIGQSGCNINFPEDKRMAPRHLELHLRPSGLEVSEASSSGVFVRIRETTPLQNGDEIMAGEEVFRVEMG